MNSRSVADALRSDVFSGAAQIALRAARLFEDALDGARHPDVDSLRADLADLAAEVLAAQPAMAPLVSLAAAVLRAASATASTTEAAAEVRSAVSRFRHTLEGAGREIAVRAEGLVPAGGRVLTLSFSSTVRAALLEAAKRRSFDVICLESRPNLEGRRTAGELAGAGLSVTVAPDAAVAALIRGCDLVLVGADSVGDLGVVNKIGTRPAALAARSAEIPLYSLADTSKLLPAAYAQPPADERPDEELWPDPPPGVRIWNRYFEATPLSFFNGMVTEQGLRSAEEIEEIRAGIRLPADLRHPRTNSAAGGRPAAP